ncbi:MAG: hypothetical protein WCX22_13230 [Methanoregula sp.]
MALKDHEIVRLNGQGYGVVRLKHKRGHVADGSVKDHRLAFGFKRLLKATKRYARNARPCLFIIA